VRPDDPYSLHSDMRGSTGGGVVRNDHLIAVTQVEAPKGGAQAIRAGSIAAEGNHDTDTRAVHSGLWGI